MSAGLQGLPVPALLLQDGNLLACATAPEGPLFERPTLALERLREMSARESVRKLGLDRGFRLEDVIAAEMTLPPEADSATAESFLRRRLPRAATLQIARGKFALKTSFAGRIGGAPTRYAREPDVRLRVEAFELHVTEHCNLRCANCCNISPLVPEHFLSVEEARALCERMSRVLIMLRAVRPPPSATARASLPTASCSLR